MSCLSQLSETHSCTPLLQLWNTSHHADDVEKELDLSLKQLGVDYLDLYCLYQALSYD